jgi:hypothetical protein
VSMLLEDDPGVQEDAEVADKAFLLAGQGVVEATKLPAGSRGVPDWASVGAKNLRGLVQISGSHYLGLCEVNGRLVEVVLDSGGARTMIDKDTARALGLNVEWATSGKSFGTYSGVTSSNSSYAGRAVGPVQVRFNQEVTFCLDELKVFEYPEPIILIGTDLLGHSSRGPYTFAYLGVNPITTAGEIVFYGRKSSQLVVCELVHAPTSHTNKHVLPCGEKKNVSFTALSQAQG